MRRDRLPYLEHDRARGRWRFARREGGKLLRVTLPGDPHNDPEASAEYWRLRQGGAPKPVERRTVRAIAASYRQSTRFPTAPRTIKDYERVLRHIETQAGHVDLAKVQRHHLVRAHQEARHGVRMADYVVTLFGMLFEHAKDLGLVRENPAHGIKKHGTQTGYLPWPDWAIAGFREQATGAALTIFELCLGTGQRIADVLEMRWSDIDDDGIAVTQGKTGAALWIPFTPALSDHLATLPRTLTTIAATRKGTPYSYRMAHDLLRVTRAKCGAEAYSWHGLRKNAAAELAEAGCSDAQIMAVTGHRTSAMVRKYTARAEQRRLARGAQARRAERD